MAIAAISSGTSVRKEAKTNSSTTSAPVAPSRVSLRMLGGWPPSELSALPSESWK